MVFATRLHVLRMSKAEKHRLRWVADCASFGSLLLRLLSIVREWRAAHRGCEPSRLQRVFLLIVFVKFAFDALHVLPSVIDADAPDVETSTGWVSAVLSLTLACLQPLVE
jgi:hypothetical protein